MPTAQEAGAIGYERQGQLFQVIAQMLSGITDQGSNYITTTLWEAVRSFYVGWKWAMDALGDGFRAAANDPSVSNTLVTGLGGVAANSSAFFGTPSGGRGYLSGTALEALRASDAYGQASEKWGAGATILMQRAAEVYAAFWRNAP